MTNLQADTARLNIPLTLEERSFMVEVKVLILRKRQTMKDFIIEAVREKFMREEAEFSPRAEHASSTARRKSAAG